MSTDAARRAARTAPGHDDDRAADAAPRLRVSETFVSLQGEGSRAGLPTAFVRLTGCALRCRWCDTEWAFTGGEWRTVGEIEREIVGSGVRHVCVTGGEPLLQGAVVPFVTRLARELRLDVVVETGGDQDISVLPEPVVRILDVKLPGSGMADRFDPRNLDRLRDGDEVKMVVADRCDYERARELVLGRLADFAGEILLSPVADELPPERLADWVLADRLGVRVQLQLHKLIWPGRERGV